MEKAQGLNTTGAVAVFPGSFDPLTNGHEDIVARALKFFDRVVVAVLSNQSKRSLFSPEERVDLLRQVFAPYGERIEVQGFSGLLVDYVQKRNTRIILRGLRAISDYDYEAQMALMNRNLCADVETFFLMSREEYSYISSTLVREVALLGGTISGFVSPVVEAALRKKIALQEKK